MAKSSKEIIKTFKNYVVENSDVKIGNIFSDGEDMLLITEAIKTKFGESYEAVIISSDEDDSIFNIVSLNKNIEITVTPRPSILKNEEHKNKWERLGKRIGNKLAKRLIMKASTSQKSAIYDFHNGYVWLVYKNGNKIRLKPHLMLQEITIELPEEEENE